LKDFSKRIVKEN